MRAYITFRVRRLPYDEQQSWIVEDATYADVEAWRRASTETPDESLTFERVRLHEIADPGRGSLRAGDIIKISTD